MHASRSAMLSRPWILSGALVLVALFASLPLIQIALAAQEEEEESELYSHMVEMNRAMRRLKRQIGDPSKNASSLDLVVAIETHALSSKVLEPPRAEGLSGKKKEEYVKHFRKEIIELLGELLELEEDLLEGNNEKAAERYKKLQEVEAHGHEEFRDNEPE